MSTRGLGILVLVVAAMMLGAPSSAAAQAAAATAAPHPTMPWNLYSQSGPGQPIRYIQVPAQQVTIELSIDVPAGVPRETQTQAVEIPGYVMTETITGYLIPEHWRLQQTGASMFQWQLVPAEFRRK
jgi:hypothetical protein